MQILADLNKDKNSITEHNKVWQRIAKKFCYYDPNRDAWRTIVTVKPPDCIQKYIIIRCKYARQTIRLSYPFRLTTELLYLWGLVTAKWAEKCNSRKIIISINLGQESKVKKAAESLGIHVDFTLIPRHRHKWGSQKRSNRFKKIRVTFPSVFKQLLFCLGFRPKKKCIPTWLSFNQKLTFLEGYLSSIEINPWDDSRVYPNLKLRFNRQNKALFHNILELFNLLEIEYSTRNNTFNGYLELIIREENILKLAEIITFHQPKIQALIAILNLARKGSSIYEAIIHFNLSALQQTLLGMILTQPDQEVEYTLFEEAFACSSNDIRTALYQLNDFGLISYQMKENNREFVKKSGRYRDILSKDLKQEVANLQRYWRLVLNNSVLFSCHDCEDVFGYAEAISDQAFFCPTCGSTDIFSTETTQNFERKLKSLKQNLEFLERCVA